MDMLVSSWMMCLEIQRALWFLYSFLVVCLKLFKVVVVCLCCSCTTRTSEWSYRSTGLRVYVVRLIDCLNYRFVMCFMFGLLIICCKKGSLFQFSKRKQKEKRRGKEKNLWKECPLQNEDTLIPVCTTYWKPKTKLVLVLCFRPDQHHLINEGTLSLSLWIPTEWNGMTNWILHMTCDTISPMRLSVVRQLLKQTNESSLVLFQWCRLSAMKRCKAWVQKGLCCRCVNIEPTIECTPPFGMRIIWFVCERGCAFGGVAVSAAVAFCIKSRWWMVVLLDSQQLVKAPLCTANTQITLK